VLVAVFDGVYVSVGVSVRDAVSVIYKIPKTASYVAVAAAGSAFRPICTAVFVTVAVAVFDGV
jgi:hypothetical protein